MYKTAKEQLAEVTKSVRTLAGTSGMWSCHLVMSWLLCALGLVLLSLQPSLASPALDDELLG